jgi:hypothetical protein
MKMELVLYGKTFLTDPNCLPFIRKSLIGHVTLALALVTKKNDICWLKMCLRDFTTKDH